MKGIRDFAHDIRRSCNSIGLVGARLVYLVAGLSGTGAEQYNGGGMAVAFRSPEVVDRGGVRTQTIQFDTPTKTATRTIK